MSKSNYIILILSVALCVSVYFNCNKPADPQNEAVEQLRKSRDSIQSFNQAASEKRQIEWEKKAESAKRTIEQLLLKDSTNKFYYAKEKAKIPHYDNRTRNHIVDSILHSAGIR